MTLLEQALAAPRATKHVRVKDVGEIRQRCEAAVAYFDGKIDGLQFAAVTKASKGASKSMARAWIGAGLSAGLVKVELVK